METKTIQPQKGVKSTLVQLNPSESFVFPRLSYSCVRTTISNLKVERPERKYAYQIIENGIAVTRLK